MNERTQLLENANTNHDALVEMSKTLQPEEIETFQELIDANKVEYKNAMGGAALADFSEQPRTEFTSPLDANKAAVETVDAIYYGNGIRRK
jgi:hypothetical protein